MDVDLVVLDVGRWSSRCGTIGIGIRRVDRAAKVVVECTVDDRVAPSAG